MGLWVRTPTHQVFIIIDTNSFDSLYLLPAWLFRQSVLVADDFQMDDVTFR